MISIVNDSVSHMNTAIPSLPNRLICLTGARLPNGNLLVRGNSGGMYCGDEYLLYKDGSNLWTKAGASEAALILGWGKYGYSSVLMDGRFFTIGLNVLHNNYEASRWEFSHLEEFSFDA